MLDKTDMHITAMLREYTTMLQSTEYTKINTDSTSIVIIRYGLLLLNTIQPVFATM